MGERGRGRLERKRLQRERETDRDRETETEKETETERERERERECVNDGVTVVARWRYACLGHRAITVTPSFMHTSTSLSVHRS